MTIWKYKHDRGGDTAPLSVTITVDGRHGVIGLNGIAPASGFPDGVIDSAGNLKGLDGTALVDYVTGAARPGIDPDPDFYRLTVRKAGKPISSLSFQPVLSSPTATDLDINALAKVGKASSATPEQLISLAAGLALVPQMQQSLADTAQSEAQRIAQQQSNNAQAAGILGRLSAASVATIGAAAGVYNITVGSEAGQVWERTGVGVTPVRRTDLEAESRNQAAILALGTGKTSADITTAGGLQTKFAGRIRDYGVVANDPTKAVMNTAAITAAVLVWEGRTLIFDGDVSGGVTTYYVTKGFNIGDYTALRGEGRVLLKIADGLPARSDERTQTAMFTGKNAWTNLTSAGTYGVTIENIEIDLNQTNSPNALLGGVKLLGAQNCTVRNNKITNISATTTQDSLFGIQVSTFANSPDCFGNLVEKNRVFLRPDWYVYTGAVLTGVNQIVYIGITLSSASAGNGGRNGAEVDEARSPANGYIASRTYNNTIQNNYVSGGSHGISATNIRENLITGNRAEGCSHRGIIITPTCDGNRIERNTLVGIGSTAIHLAYDSRNNYIGGNVVIGVLNVVEGDGIKSYVYGQGNIIEGNILIDVGRNAIRFAHGAHDNIARGNQIIWTKGTGTPGSPEETAYQLTSGIVLKGFSQPQYDQDATLRKPSMYRSYNNIIQGNNVRGVYKGIGLYTDDASKAPLQVSNNNISGNIVSGVGTAYFHDPANDAVISGNILTSNMATGNVLDYSATLPAACVKIAANTNLTDKPAPATPSPTPSAAPATPFTITPVTTGGSIGGTITGLTANAGSTTGNRRRYYIIYTFTPSVGNAFGDQTITSATGFTCEIQSPTALKNSNGAPTYATLMTATSLRVDANSGAVQVRLTADLIG